jgi:hypothetical protein
VTAIVLPDIDRSTIEDLRKMLPNLKEIELPALPKMGEVSKTADDTINRLLGRSRAPVWPWVAAGVGLVAVIGAIAAYFAWFRRPAWDTSGDALSSGSTYSTDLTATDLAGGTDDMTDLSAGGTGLTAVESSLGSTSYPIEEA